MTTAILLLTVVAMVVFAVIHPFFRFDVPPILTVEVRRAIAAKAMLVLAYWTVCFALTLALVVVAWLDIREVRRRLAEVRRDLARQLASRSQAPGKRNGPT